MSDTNTLDGMSVEQLRDLAKRAEATAAKKAKEKDEKDIVPPVGTEWEYNGRYWVTEYQSEEESMVLSIPKKGGAIKGAWFTYGRFSRPSIQGFRPSFKVIEPRSPGVIAKLALRVRDA